MEVGATIPTLKRERGQEGEWEEKQKERKRGRGMEERKKGKKGS